MASPGSTRPGAPRPMRAAVLHGPRKPLQVERVPIPLRGDGQILVQVKACGICRTDLHIIDGDLSETRWPIILGHEVVGTVVEGDGHPTGTRVGIPWLAFACGRCADCRAGQENLCAQARFTGYQRDGGFAEYLTADARFCFPLPSEFSDVEAAPLLCAGLIGYRALRLAGDGERLGLYGFGAAAHLVAQTAIWQGKQVFAFTRPGDLETQAFAQSLGATWAGGSDVAPPDSLDAAIIFATVGELVPLALAAVRPGGTVVCGGIHMSAIPSFPYSLLWGERVLRSVANLTRRDATEFLALAARAGLHPTTRRYDLENANHAIADLRRGAVHGAAVLVP